jgi:outer membrane protein assembly factor BamB
MTRIVALSSSALLVLGGLAVSSRPTHAQNNAAAWLQWGGPTRNFHVESAPIAHSWPEPGPRQLWRHPLGEGYSSVLVDGAALVTMYRHDDDEVVVALDAETGDRRWVHSYRAPLLHNGNFDVWLNSAGPGPYATPLIAEGTVFALGANGHFRALDLRTGVLRWAHNLVEQFKLQDYNAFTASPLAFRSNVIVPLGSSQQGVVAFNRETGALAWQSDSIPLGPGSPVLINLEGQDELVIWGQQEVAALNPESGRLLWRHPHPTEIGLNISTPVWGPGNRLFVSSAYGGGSRMISLSWADGRTTPREIWFNSRMRLHFGTGLWVGNLIVGTSGDFGPAFMVALDAETGAELWRDRSFARAQIVDASGTLVIVDESGEIAVASVARKGLLVHARKQLLQANAWTPPTVVGSTLFVRDRKEILALDLRP